MAPRIYLSLLLLIAFASCSDALDQTRAVGESSLTSGVEAMPTVAQVSLDSSAYQWENGHILLTWRMLSNVQFELEYNEDLEAEIPMPLFGESVKKLNGKPVQVRGYVIPISELNGPFTILSALPYKQCFFCGGAGPETVMDIFLQEGESRHFSMDETTTFRGRLRLNSDDFDYLNYILEDAEVVD